LNMLIGGTAPLISAPVFGVANNGSGDDGRS